MATMAAVSVASMAQADPKGAGVAESAPSATPAAGSEAGPLAVNNLGLDTTRAKKVQCWLRDFWGYTGPIDGLLGTASWKAFQRNLRAFWGYTGSIDGDVGEGTIKALQRLLRNWGYTGDIDGIAGSGTQAAFKNFADGQSC